MSDIRALLAGRDVEVNDGSYFERIKSNESEIEERLRSFATQFTKSNLNQLKKFVRKVNEMESTVHLLDDVDLRNMLRQTAQKMQNKGFSDDLVAKAFAIIREASLRTLGMRHHDVQLMAARTILQARIAEMATGEGKTLSATLAVCTAAAVGAAVHVVTVNDYLAKRDAEENASLYSFFGFSLGVVVQDMPIEDRRKQYDSNITYVSNKELTFDYLKDRITLGNTLSRHIKLRHLMGSTVGPQSILRGLHVAIVDEADSVMIDEARTPLIISETIPDDLDEEVYFQSIAIAKQLTLGIDFIKGADRDVWLTSQGEYTVKLLTKDFSGVWKSHLWTKELMQKALSALYLFQQDQHYIVVDNKVQIVDEFTGRVMPDRTWERGLHQMIEAKESCEISQQRRTLSQITYQRFFGRYLLLAGMTGTAKEVESELKRSYDISVTKIPTHKPSKRVRLPDRVFLTSQERWEFVVIRIAELVLEGRAILVGTRSVEASEYLSELLQARGLQHVVLNARQDKDEALAVSQAGQSGQITVATNMAGRGTDIKLTPDALKKGGLHVILTEFHESARIDRQLFGRSARQGDDGSAEAIVSLEDELFTRYAPFLRVVGKQVWLGVGGVNTFLFRLFVNYAQSRAERSSRKVRLDAIKNDRKWVNALGFVGVDKK